MKRPQPNMVDGETTQAMLHGNRSLSPPILTNILEYLRLVLPDFG